MSYPKKEEVLILVETKLAAVRSANKRSPMSQAELDKIILGCIRDLKALLSPATAATETIPETTREKFLRLDRERKEKRDKEAARRAAWLAGDRKKAEAVLTTPPQEPKKEPNK